MEVETTKILDMNAKVCVCDSTNELFFSVLVFSIVLVRRWKETANNFSR